MPKPIKSRRVEGIPKDTYFCQTFQLMIEGTRKKVAVALSEGKVIHINRENYICIIVI